MSEIKLNGKNNTWFVNGVSNQEMIPMLKEVAANEDLGGLMELKTNYSTVFESSLKYIGKTRQNKINEMLGIPTIEKPATEKPKNVVELKSKNNRWFVNGISNQEMIPMLKEAVATEDVGGLFELKTNYPTVFKSSLKYIGKNRQNKIQELLDFELPQAI